MITVNDHGSPRGSNEGCRVAKRQNVTVAWLEQVWVPALHTWYVYVAWPRPPGESV